MEPLQKIADVLNHEPEEISVSIRENIREGMHYAKARSEALVKYFDGQIEDLDHVLETSNNILGIEYLRAIDRLGSALTPYTIKRWTTEYHSKRTYEDTASATALRSMLYEEDGFEQIVPYVPPFVAREFAIKYGASTPIRANDFSQILQYQIEKDRDCLPEYLDFAPELAERVNNLLPDVYQFKEWSSAMKSKNFTHTRINRALLHVILGIRESDLEEYRDEDFCMYARILGFRKASAKLFTEISNSTPLPLITKMADAKTILSPKAMKLLQFDINGANIYRNVVYQKYGTLLKDEFTNGLVREYD